MSGQEIFSYFNGEYPESNLAVERRDYIDYINGSEMTDPIMKGSDIFGRPFLLFRIKADGQNPIALSLFQRYTDNIEIWRFAFPHYGSRDTFMKLLDYFGNSNVVLERDDFRLQKLKALSDMEIESLSIS